MNRENFRHFYHDIVRWGDCDMLGHLNNAIFLRFLESARIAYIKDIYDLELAPDTVEGWVIVDLNCSFKGQVHHPASLDIGSRITRVGNSSAIIEAAIFPAEEDHPVFTSTATIVWCNYSEGAAVRIPDFVRDATREFEGNVEGL